MLAKKTLFKAYISNKKIFFSLIGGRVGAFLQVGNEPFPKVRLDSGSIKTSPRDGLRAIGKEMYTMILELEILKK